MSNRKCYVILDQNFEEGRGFIPALVTENEPGFALMSGNGPGSSPWYWGMTKDEAKRIAAKANEESFGLTPEEAQDILLSSMVASRAGR
jgi:hypothetical protein